MISAIVKKWKKLPKSIRRAVNIIITTILCAAMIYSCFTASGFGANVGSHIGHTVGNALGSYHGITSGLVEGADAGREAGLSAEDTEVVIQELMHETSNLEIMEVTLSEDQCITTDPSDTPDYAALYTLGCEVTFTVDLSKASVETQSNGRLLITIPDPLYEVNVNEQEINRIAEYQKHSFTGDALEGMTAYQNIHIQLDQKIRTELSNSSALMQQARNAAQNQVSMLAKNAYVGEDFPGVDVTLDSSIGGGTYGK